MEIVLAGESFVAFVVNNTDFSSGTSDGMLELYESSIIYWECLNFYLLSLKYYRMYFSHFLEKNIVILIEDHMNKKEKFFLIK